MGKSGAYKADSAEAKNHVYANNGVGPCPFPDGSRPARLWHKWRSHYHNMESVMDEMAEVYGEFRSDRISMDQAKETVGL